MLHAADDLLVKHGYGALTVEAQHDPGTAESFHKRYLGPRRRQERDMLARATEAGEISPTLGPDATIDVLVGPIVYCAMTRLSIPAAWRTPLSTICSSLAPTESPLGVCMTDEAIEGRDAFPGKRDPGWSRFPYYY